ncbi:ISBma1, transposase [Burkholderia pseudomallei]|nr:ISBma1, transposase [Burkholderia pseudomallei]
MIDQMFTAENFRRIYDAENRKGIDLATRYFPSLEPFTLAVRDKVQVTCLISSGHFNLGERPRLLQLNNTAA